MPIRGNRSIQRLEDVLVDVITRVERKLDRLSRHQRIQELGEAMDRTQLDRLIADTTKNTDAVQAATKALNAYVTSTADLTAKLQTALDAAGPDVTPEIQKAADALEANTKMLSDATPKVAQAIDANT